MGRFAIGTDNFVEYKEKSAYYIDKSLFIKEIIDDTNKVMLITRPRRFGKTLNMSMLDSYLSYCDQNYSHLYSDLKIWKLQDEYGQYFQNTPVVFFTMKNICCDNWDECYSMLVIMIAKIYRDKLYIREKLSEIDKEIFDIILRQDKKHIEHFKNGLAYLVNWLYENHKKRVFIIIDEYDTPIHEGFQHDYYEKIIEFMQIFFGAAMKSNPSVEKAVLTGITKIAGESLFSKLNLFVSYNITTEYLADSFGFTEEETQIVFEKFAPFRNMEAIKRMYNGYLIGGVKLYNPWSIMNVLDNSEKMPLKPYWYNTSSDKLLRRQLIKKTPGFKEALLKLASGESISRKIKDEVTFVDLTDNGDSIWSFLLYSGYLTLKKFDINTDKTYDLIIPNEEVCDLMQNIIESWFTEGLAVEDIEMFFGAMLTGDVTSFQEQLQSKVENSFSYFDTTRTKPEQMYHSFILGILVLLSKDYYCESNANVGKGRCDILICPKTGTFKDTGVILEFKKTNDKSKLEQITDEALLQIKEKNYIEGAKKRGVKTIYCYGIGFYREELLVKMDSMNLKSI